MATEEPAPEKARSPWSSWDSRRAEPPSPTAEAVMVESGSDDDDEVQSPRLDAPELNLDEDVAGGNSTELRRTDPVTAARAAPWTHAPGPRQWASRRALAMKGGWPWDGQPTLLPRMGSRRPLLRRRLHRLPSRWRRRAIASQS